MMASLSLDSDQLGVVRIDHEDGEQLCGLGGAGVLTDGVTRPGPFGPAFAGMEDLRRPIIHLAADRPGQNIGSDEGRMRMAMNTRVSTRNTVGTMSRSRNRKYLAMRSSTQATIFALQKRQ